MFHSPGSCCLSQHAWPEPPFPGQWDTGVPGLGGSVVQIQAQIPTEFGRLGDAFSLRSDQSFTFLGDSVQSPSLCQVMSLADSEHRLFFVSLVIVLRCLNSLWFQPLRVSKPGVSSPGGSVVGVYCGRCSVISSCVEGLRCQLGFIIIIFYFILLVTILQQTRLWLPANPSAPTLPITTTRTRSAAPNPAQTDLTFQVLSPSFPPFQSKAVLTG